MKTDRMSAFTDGIVAILITIMVLNLKIPAGPNWSDLFKSRDVFITYLASFIILAIFWNNHHHLLHLIKFVTGKDLWWNILLLFFMSFIPFSTEWIAHYIDKSTPEIFYALNILHVDVAYNLLSYNILKKSNFKIKESKWMWKGVFSMAALVVGIAGAFLFDIPQLCLISSIISLIPWAVPDQQIEKYINSNHPLT